MQGVLDTSSLFIYFRLVVMAPSLVSKTPSALDRSLAPLWKLTCYCGLLLDWCRPMSRKSRCACATVRYLAIATHLLITIYGMACDLVRLKNDMNDTVLHIVTEAMDFIIQPIILFIWAYFMLHRKSMMVFFDAWAKQQIQLQNSSQQNEIKWVTIGVYLIYGSFATTIFCLFMYYAFTTPLSPHWDITVSYYPSLSDDIYYCTLNRLIRILQGFHFCVFFLLMDIVPIMVYYLSSKIIQSIEIEIIIMENCKSSNNNLSDYLEPLSLRFEAIRSLVHRTDHLFGCFVVLSQGVSFFNICSSVYSLLNCVRGSCPQYSGAILALLITFFNYLVRMTLTVLLIAKVRKSSGSLLSAVNCLSVRRCRLSNKEERRVLKTFLGSLQHEGLAACPSGLYKITSSVLLSLLSLVMSYTIILLQTNGDSPSSTNNIKNVTTGN